MYLVYQPEGSEEPQRWKYNPKKLLTPEREDIERRTGYDFAEFTTRVLKGNSLCRRALLYVFLRRDHAKVRYEDVAFAWDELTLEHSKGELLLMREKVSETVPADQLAAVLEKLDEEIAEAFEDPDEEGKASLPIAG
ncbi:hypothetical protein PV735_31575 [Streptomyces turgidiscabies]|uniref:hypothetical protein n=1 Tax=Streptomyces turgidiscabies TaxID=85558 RepID=UPI0029B62409|nr:hypothetical protein [Streptomyces turgidiscabies]MDX3497192.1 hypothetical protein [Streptomyces turgidiscabies]